MTSQEGGGDIPAERRLLHSNTGIDPPGTVCAFERRSGTRGVKRTKTGLDGLIRRTCWAFFQFAALILAKNVWQPYSSFVGWRLKASSNIPITSLSRTPPITRGFKEVHYRTHTGQVLGGRASWRSGQRHQSASLPIRRRTTRGTLRSFAGGRVREP
jgi:hypothetical protein